MAFVMSKNITAVAQRFFKINNASRCIRAIATSEKKKDGVTITETLPKDIPDFSKPLENKNWVSYGFCGESEKEDVNALHSITFVSVTLCFIIGGFFFTYFPDFKSRDWAQREAFLEIRRREALGLPLIDRNYIDPATIVLPSDEELGNAEIII